jgi:hypothetical protein
MPDQDMFNTPPEEARQLADELRQVKEVLKDISGKLTRIETRARRAFPTAFPKPTPRERGAAKTQLTAPPTMTREQVMAAYDQAVKTAKAGDTEGARGQIEGMELGNLNLLRTELGAPIGKKKPSKSVLLAAVLGRLNESVMLAKHTNRQELIDRSEMGGTDKSASNEGQS